MSKILVTGGAGYIGSRTCRTLHEQGFTPIAFDNLSRGKREFVCWGPFVEGDIRSREQIVAAIQEHKPLACVHFAAFAYVGESVGDPLVYYQNNVGGSLTLADALITNGVKHIVFSSTCATYGEPTDIPILETNPQLPTNPYGWSKFFVEQMLRDLEPTDKLRSVSLRYFNACGAHEDSAVGEAHDPEPHLVPRAIMVALGKLPHLDILGTDYATRDGTAIRDYVHISDLADAHVAALRYLLDGGTSGAFNLGMGRGYTVREVVRSVERVSGCTIASRDATRRPGDPSVLVADTTKARSILNFVPRYQELDAIVQTAWDWHLSREGGTKN